MAETPLRAEQLVEGVRARATQSVRQHPPFPPLERALPAHELREHPGLRYAHEHWALPASAPEMRTRGLRSRIKRVAGILAFAALREYLTEERELAANLVRLNDALATRCDELSAAYFGLLDELDARAARSYVVMSQLASEIDLRGRDDSGGPLSDTP